MSDARSNILKRLRQNQVESRPVPPSYQPWRQTPAEGSLQQLIQRMRAVHTEVVELGKEDWISWANRELPRRNLNRVLVGSHQQGRNYIQQADNRLEVMAYDDVIETWKGHLFHKIDVAITRTRGAIAETGSLILWPDESEPRLMSLVPPVHIALLDANQIHQNLAGAISSEHWATQMPTNALLISGPSKTADIEQTLAYGIHGPQQLIVLVI